MERRTQSDLLIEFSPKEEMNAILQKLYPLFSKNNLFPILPTRASARPPPPRQPIPLPLPASVRPLRYPFDDDVCVKDVRSWGESVGARGGRGAWEGALRLPCE